MTGALTADVVVHNGDFALDVSCTVAPGELVAILGPNGAGKTTLLRALAGLVRLTSGTVTLDGQTLDDRAVHVPTRQRSVGMVFQDTLLFEQLTLAANIAFGPRAQGMGKRAARIEAQRWLERFDLTDLADRRPAQLSGGQAQRAALARALAAEPRLLLLDEPLAALDARTRMAVRTELGRHLAAFGGPALLVTHDPVDALVLAERLLIIEDGRVVQQGSPQAVLARPATDYVAALVGLNLFTGHADGNILRLSDGRQLVIAGSDHTGEVLATVRPSAVSIHRERPTGTSARNSWAGTIDDLAMLSDRVRISIDAALPIVAEVTGAAVAEMSLHPGVPVWVSVKATQIDVYSHDWPTG